MDLVSAIPAPFDVLPRLLVRGTTRRAYYAQQAAIRYSLLASHMALRALSGNRLAPPPEAVAALRREYERLQEQDVRNVERGFYPASLLFGLPLAAYARRLPGFLLDLPRVWGRSRRGDFEDVPEIEGRRFPAYFKRTFHWQTDGYLSRESAGRYDLAVEFLFMGCADVMRRQVIPPLARLAHKHRGGPLRILDVGCGTGRTLVQIAEALPGHQYFGLDLSPFYVEEARRQLEAVPEVSLVVENAEKLPYRDGYFDAVTSVYLLHELPRRTRRAVVSEMARVLRPGGLLVLEDSAQYREAADLAAFLDSFAEQMHEPYYRDYVRDDVEEQLAGAGLEVGSTQRTWLAKVVTGRKPAGH